jgi:hypothetical protein
VDDFGFVIGLLKGGEEMTNDHLSVGSDRVDKSEDELGSQLFFVAWAIRPNVVHAAQH